MLHLVETANGARCTAVAAKLRLLFPLQYASTCLQRNAFHLGSVATAALSVTFRSLAGAVLGVA
jgi:hypothetical protein